MIYHPFIEKLGWSICSSKFKFRCQQLFERHATKFRTWFACTIMSSRPNVLTVVAGERHFDVCTLNIILCSRPKDTKCRRHQRRGQNSNDNEHVPSTFFGFHDYYFEGESFDSILPADRRTSKYDHFQTFIKREHLNFGIHPNYWSHWIQPEAIHFPLLADTAIKRKIRKLR